MGKITYSVEITGNEPPFKWQAIRHDSMGRKTNLGGTGEVDTVEEAMFQASEYVHEVEAQRKWNDAKRVEEILVVDTSDDALPDIWDRGDVQY
jgi:hypothetical protein